MAERGVRQIRPIAVPERAQKHDPVAPLAERIGPGQRRDAARADRREQRRLDQRRIGIGQRRLAQDKPAEPREAPRANAAGRGIERHVVLGDDMRGEFLLDLGLGDGRRQHDARPRGGAGDLGHGQIGLARQRVGGIERCTAAVGCEELAKPARTRPGDAVGISQGQNGAGACRIDPASRAARALLPVRGQSARILAAAAAIARQHGRDDGGDRCPGRRARAR